MLLPSPGGATGLLRHKTNGPAAGARKAKSLGLIQTGGGCGQCRGVLGQHSCVMVQHPAGAREGPAAPSLLPLFSRAGRLLSLLHRNPLFKAKPGCRGAETIQTLPLETGWGEPRCAPHPSPRQYLVLAGGQSHGGKGSGQRLKPPSPSPGGRRWGAAWLQEPGRGGSPAPSPSPASRRGAQSSATMDKARSSLSLASFSRSRCSSLKPGRSICAVRSLKILCISV